MNLQQAADEAMSYLDSVGVAAEYEIRMYDYKTEQLAVFTDDCIIGISSKAIKLNHQEFMDEIKQQHPQKSPTILTKDYLDQYSKRNEYFDFLGAQKSPA